MSTPTESRIELIGHLQKAIKSENIDLVLDYFDPNVEYHYHVGSRPIKGHEWLRKFFVKYWANNAKSTWKILNWAENGGNLFTEGMEEYTNADGVLVQHPYMGIIEFDAGGKIIAWRDYFQMADPNAGK